MFLYYIYRIGCYNIHFDDQKPIIFSGTGREFDCFRKVIESSSKEPLARLLFKLCTVYCVRNYGRPSVKPNNLTNILYAFGASFTEGDAKRRRAIKCADRMIHSEEYLYEKYIK